MRFAQVLAVLACGILMMPLSAHAEGNIEDVPPPATKEELAKIKKQKKEEESADKVGLPIEVRYDAMKESALSYGARGGLAWRTFYIRQEMETRSRYMDKVFDFRKLLIAAPSGLLIEPPIVSESIDAMLIEQGGQAAAVADRVYNIGRSARIVSTARTWRAYLERQWGVISPPPDILLPSNATEQKNWDEWFDKGWKAGVEQADEIFQADLNKLNADYQGMIRYRTLLKQGMISPPYALQVDRGVTGSSNEMRVGDRSLSITGQAGFKTGTQEWQPANR